MENIVILLPTNQGHCNHNEMAALEPEGLGF